MNPSTRPTRQSRKSARGAGRGARPASRFAPAVVGLEARALLATITVTNTNDAGPGSLRAAVLGAASGDTVAFAPKVTGTITLTGGPIMAPAGQDLTIQGPGASALTIRSVGPPGVLSFSTGGGPAQNKVAISGLTFADSQYALFDLGSALTVTDTVFRGNSAPSGGGSAIGTQGTSMLTLARDLFVGNSSGTSTSSGNFALGAVFNTGTATVSDCTFIGNVATSGDLAFGGAIHTFFSSSLTVTGSVFTGNGAVTDPDTGSAAGGAIYVDSGATITVDSSRFAGNSVVVGVAGGGGGAIHSDGPQFPEPAVTQTIRNSQFTGNTVFSPSSGGSEGGALDMLGVGLVVSGSTFVDNQAIGDTVTSGFSPPALGGAVYTFGPITFTSDQFLGNVARGGTGPMGPAFGAGGAVVLYGEFGAGTSTIAGSQFSQNRAVAGPGGGGVFDSGSGFGGAVSVVGGGLTVTDSNFVANQARGSDGTAGAAGGTAAGGALQNQGPTTATVTVQGGSFVGNVAIGGAGGNSATGTGGAGGGSFGGAISTAYGTLAVSGSAFVGDAAVGGAGGNGLVGGAGGNGQGGAIISSDSSSLTVSDSLFLFDAALAGLGGAGATAGADGQGLGGGIAVLGGTDTLTGNIFALNRATTKGRDVSVAPTP